MPCFTILPSDEACSAMELVSNNAAWVLHMVSWLPTRAADVLRDGEYAFSARADKSGFWAIFRYEIEPEDG